MKEIVAEQGRWYEKSVDAVFEELGTSTHGLTASEAELRLNKYGLNTIAKEDKNRILKLLFRNFNSILIYVLLGSALVSLLSDHLIEFTVIILIVVLTVMLGFIQEYSAGNSLKALAKLTVKEVEVIRNGKRCLIGRELLVLGDAIVLKRGIIIPADIRVVESRGLAADESTLTGESVQKFKQIKRLEQQNVPIADQHNMLFSGTSITNGEGLGIVVGTGLNSELGKISLTISKVGDQKSPLQKQVDQMSKRLAYGVLAVCAFLLVFMLAKGVDRYEALLLVGAIAVSGIPESFPLALTVALSNGVKIMAKKNALVRDLNSVETLGTTTVICTDKTGTLTKNEMVVEKLFFADKNEIDVQGKEYIPNSTFSSGGNEIGKRNLQKYKDFFRSCILCSNAHLNNNSGEWNLLGEPTEGAILVAAKSAGFDETIIREDNPRIYEKPFDPYEKYMVTVNQSKNKVQTAFLKGAAEKVIHKSSYYRDRNGKLKKMLPSDRAAFQEQVRSYGSQTLRVLAIATKRLKKQIKPVSQNQTFDVLNTDYVFEGLLGMDDPIRPEVTESIKECMQANIRVVIITGDHKVTAKSIGKKLGLLSSENNLIMEGHELDNMDDEELDKAIGNVTIFSRVTPDHKFRIVSSLQRKGDVVAMTGDGVNDAPALKKADIGVSMGKSGTDVAREASNMVLADDNFATIVKAVKQGRTIYSNIRRFVFYLLTGNFTEVSLITIAIFLGLSMPLTALMVLFINIVTSTFPAMALSIESTSSKVMTQMPRNAKESILSRYVLLKILVLVPLLLIGTLAAFLWELHMGSGNIENARTMAFAALILFELFHAFNARSLHSTIFNKKFFSNKYMFIAVLVSLSITFVAIYTDIGQRVFSTVPLTAMQWLALTAIASIVIFVSEIVKALVKSELREQRNLQGANFKID